MIIFRLQYNIWNKKIVFINLKRNYGIESNFIESKKFSSKKNTFQYRKMSTNKNNSYVAPEESLRFMKDCFTTAGASDENALAMADLLVAADLRGHFSHGMNRLEMYINDLLQHSTDGLIKPIIVKNSPSTAWVDGQNGLGAVVGNFCMDIAIEKAKITGVGIVCAKRSNHYGMAGYYAQRAMNQGLIGMSMTNTSPLMTPTRSKTPALGTNPISFGAQTSNDKFLLDMATTAVAVGKIEMQRRKNEPIPSGWAQDTEGKPVTNPHEAFEAGCLYPLGGPEISSGYKGYGLGAMVDIFCGILGGANYSTKIRKWTLVGEDEEANLGCTFIAINPNCFAPNFDERLEDFNNILRSQTPIDPNKPVLVPGDVETQNLNKTKISGGIQYLPNQLQSCDNLAKKLKITPLNFVEQFEHFQK